ncbi:MAG: biotin carboxylase N-terminal domain-containing protein [Micropepsaceae bacterium]
MNLHRPFKSVLIANRGEIAVRIVREAKAANLRAIAVYSDADKRALHVESADAAVHIGPSPARDSYLNVANILAAAKQTNAEAIHPGYGFLSENPDFAQAVIDAGLVWIGPSPDAIRAMGDKGNAKEIARKAGVPVIPGYDGDDQSDAKLLAEAKKIGWPVLIKAALGGGGRGQRRVTQDADFADALASARREALSAFASDRMILERALDNVRHIEVQIFGDAHGDVIHLGERDCSVQRRNQKIIEEAPAPGVSEDLRTRMGTAAVALAKAVNYTNAGTVEYLLDRNGNFYFLEMNTRIQVEHPVTEEVTGLNLVAMQFDVAMGIPLRLKQSNVTITGHAIEARVCAEDPEDGFAPQTGKITTWLSPRWVRCDNGVAWEGEVPGDYDSLLAKFIGRGPTREGARTKLVRALEDFLVLGVKTNRNYLLQLLEMPAFRSGTHELSLLGTLQPDETPRLQTEHATIAAMILARGSGNTWATTGTRRSPIRLRASMATREFHSENDNLNGMRLISIDESDNPCNFTVADETGSWVGHFEKQNNRVQVHYAGTDEVFEDITYAPAEPKGGAGANVIRAPMAGRIVKVLAEPGAAVAKGQLLVILEAMKMEHELRAATDGVVESVTAKQGDQVAIRQTMVTLKAT